MHRKLQPKQDYLQDIKIVGYTSKLIGIDKSIMEETGILGSFITLKTELQFELKRNFKAKWLTIWHKQSKRKLT